MRQCTNLVMVELVMDAVNVVDLELMDVFVAPVLDLTDSDECCSCRACSSRLNCAVGSFDGC